MLNPFDRCAGSASVIDHMLGNRAYDVVKKVAESVDGLAGAIEAAEVFAALKLEIESAVNDAADKLLRLHISPISFGAKFDGIHDDYPAIQHSVDLGHQTGRPLLMPGGVAGISQPVSIVGKAVSIVGAAGNTTFRALQEMECVIDGYEETDSYYNPCNLENLILDGNDMVTDAVFRARFRHHMTLRTIWTQNPGDAQMNFRVKDSWLCRYFNLRTLRGLIGFYAQGANHGSTWDGCDFNAVTGKHLWIGNDAEVNDGNHGLTFTGCSTEFSDDHLKKRAIGVQAESNTSAKFVGGYYGENIYGPGIVNNGAFLDFDGAIVFMGATYPDNPNIKSNLIVPNGGKTLIQNGRLADQGGIGLSGIAFLEEGQDAVATGKILLKNVDIYTPLGGGTRIIKGDVFDRGIPHKNFVKGVGRAWSVLDFNDATHTELVTKTDKICTVTTGGGLVSMFGSFKDIDELSFNTPGLIILTYMSTQPVTIALTSMNGGVPDPTIEVLPSTEGKWWTYINAQPNIGPNTTGIQLYMNGAPKDAKLGVRACTFSDERLSRNSMAGGPSYLGHI